MTKQKDISEGIAQLIFDWTNCVKEDAADNYGLSGKILAYLHSKGVVIKGGKPSRIATSINNDGLVAVEPLIKDE